MTLDSMVMTESLIKSSSILFSTISLKGTIRWGLKIVVVLPLVEARLKIRVYDAQLVVEVELDIMLLKHRYRPNGIRNIANNESNPDVISWSDLYLDPTLAKGLDGASIRVDESKLLGKRLDWIVESVFERAYMSTSS